MADPSTVVDMTGTSAKIIRQGKVLFVSFHPVWVSLCAYMNTKVRLC